jgi:hypothetical protein
MFRGMACGPSTPSLPLGSGARRTGRRAVGDTSAPEGDGKPDRSDQTDQTDQTPQRRQPRAGRVWPTLLSGYPQATMSETSAEPPDENEAFANLDESSDDAPGVDSARW